MEFLRAKGQVGYPPTIPTDAQLGYAVIAYHSDDILFDICGEDGSRLVRQEDTCTTWPAGAKLGSASVVLERPKSRRPYNMKWERSPTRKALGLILWGENGLRAERRYAPQQLVGYLPQHWDWAAQPLFMSAPPLFGDLIEPAEEKKYPQPPQNAEKDPSVGSKQLEKGFSAAPLTSVSSGAGVAPTPEDLNTRRCTRKNRPLGRQAGEQRRTRRSPWSGHWRQ